MGGHRGGRVAGRDSHRAGVRAGRGGQRARRRPAASQRLVPAAGRPARCGGYAGESGALRDYVTSGRPAAIEPFRDVVGQMPGRQARVAGLVRGYPHMPDRLAAERAALRAWQARVAGPQLAAAARGDFARARILQDDVPLIRPYSLAVRTTVAALQAQITNAQATVVTQWPAPSAVSSPPWPPSARSWSWSRPASWWPCAAGCCGRSRRCARQPSPSPPATTTPGSPPSARPSSRNWAGRRADADPAGRGAG